jgi:hypothetical protein
MSATTAKGLVIVSVDPAPMYSTGYTAGSMQAVESEVITLAAGMEHSWISKPMGPSAHLFRPIGDHTNAMTNFDWTSLVVEITGGDLTTDIAFVTVEYVLNLEMTMRTGGTGNAVAQLQKTPPKPSQPALAAAAHSHATRSSFVQGGIAQATNYLEKTAKSSLDSILADGMSLLFGAL